MSSALILQRLRRFLFGLAALLCLGTLTELWFTKQHHAQTPIQLVPFGLCALGLCASLVAWIRPRPLTLRGLRACMVLLLGGSVLGIYEHIASNLEYLLEIHVTATARDVFMEALSGASPLLAPGVLAVAAVVALAASYHHPALRNATMDEQVNE
jgi:hypothetical protein